MARRQFWSFQAARRTAAWLAAVAVLAGCAPGATSVATSTRTHKITHRISPLVRPVRTGPTTAVRAPVCPLLGRRQAADRIGMRLARITVLRSGGRLVGCRFYALHGSPLHASEHLPGPSQPAVEILLRRYRAPAAAHNAFVRAASSGRDPQRERIEPGSTGVCYQSDFYPPDRGRDWACGFSTGRTSVLVRTVVTSPALDAVLVARAIAGRI